MTMTIWDRERESGFRNRRRRRRRIDGIKKKKKTRWQPKRKKEGDNLEKKKTWNEGKNYILTPETEIQRRRIDRIKRKKKKKVTTKKKKERKEVTTKKEKKWRGKKYTWALHPSSEWNLIGNVGTKMPGQPITIHCCTDLFKENL